MTMNGEVSEPGRKRARTGDAVVLEGIMKNNNKNEGDGPTKEASASDVLRAKKISNRFSALLKEFPEIKFILDFENLQEHLETAVVKYVEEKEAKKRNAQLDMNYGQNTVPLYSLPDEVLSNCLSFVGKGYYGVIGLVSKKINESYKEEFGSETAYLEMATSVNLANYCLNKLCKSLEEKDEMLKAAAVNGNLDILRAAVKDGYELFPLVAMKKTTIYPDDSDYDEDYGYDDNDEDQEFDVYYAEDDEKQYSWKPEKVKLFKLVKRGHLHVLKYLYEELNYFLGLQRYCKPAIEYGQLEILDWLDHICIMEDDSLRIGYMNDHELKTNLDFCECAIKSGNIESLEWFMEMGYDINGDNSKVLVDAIRSKSIEMIQYCFDLGYDNLNTFLIHDAVKQTKSVDVYRLVHEFGCEFGEIKFTVGYASRINEYFEIIKFFRSISVPWGNGVMNDIVEYGTLELIQYAHEEGCPWTTHGEEYYHLLRSSKWSFDKLNYLKDNGCTLDYENSYSSSLVTSLRRRKDLVLLDYFVGKNSSFDNKLYKEIVKYEGSWLEGISYMLENGKDIENFKSIEEAFHNCNQICGIKFFHSLGLPWCLDSSRNNHLLSKIACYNDLDDVKWAYANGCKGGDLVPYVEEEWNRRGIRHREEWKANQIFFDESGLLDEAFLEKSGLKKQDPTKVQEIGDAQLESVCFGYQEREDCFFKVDICSLANLVNHGYKFRSYLEQESLCKEAYKKCCVDPQKEDYRKRLALFVGMGVRDL